MLVKQGLARSCLGSRIAPIWPRERTPGSMMHELLFHDPLWLLALLAVPVAFWVRAIRPRENVVI